MGGGGRGRQLSKACFILYITIFITVGVLKMQHLWNSGTPFKVVRVSLPYTGSFWRFGKIRAVVTGSCVENGENLSLDIYI